MKRALTPEEVADLLDALIQELGSAPVEFHFASPLSDAEGNALTEALVNHLNITQGQVGNYVRTSGGSLRYNLPRTVKEHLSSFQSPPGLTMVGSIITISGSARFTADAATDWPFSPAECFQPKASAFQSTVDMAMGGRVTLEFFPPPVNPVLLFFVRLPGSSNDEVSIRYSFSPVGTLECSDHRRPFSLLGERLSLPPRGAYNGVFLYPAGVPSVTIEAPAAEQGTAGRFRLAIVEQAGLERYDPRLQVDVFSSEPARVPIAGATVDIHEEGFLRGRQVTSADGHVEFDREALSVGQEFNVSVRVPSNLGVWTAGSSRTGLVTTTEQEASVELEFTFYGCLTAVVLDKNDVGLPGVLVKYALEGGATFEAVTDERGHAFHRLLPGVYAVSTDGISRGRWRIYSRQCLVAALPQEVPSYMVTLVEPTLLFSTRIVIKPGEAVSVDGNATIDSVALGVGSSLGVGVGSSLSVSEGINSTGGSLTLGSGSNVNVAGGFAAVDGAVVDVSQGGNLLLGNLDVRGNSSVVVDSGSSLTSGGVQVDNGSSLSLSNTSGLTVEGDFTAADGSSFQIQDGAQLNVTGTFVGNVTLVGDNIPKLCETKTVTIANVGVPGAPPQVALASSTAGVSTVTSYSGNTLSAVISLLPPTDSDDVSARGCFDAGADQAGNPLEQWEMMLIALGIVAIGTIFFAVFLVKSRKREIERRTREAQQVIQRRQEQSMASIRAGLRQQAQSEDRPRKISFQAFKRKMSLKRKASLEKKRTAEQIATEVEDADSEPDE